MHASSMSLVLNPKTGYVSPQFHCIYDDQFDSAKTDKNFSAVWAEKAGLQQKASQQVPDDDCAKKVIPERMQAPFTEEDIEADEGDRWPIPDEPHKATPLDKVLPSQDQLETEGAIEAPEPPADNQPVQTSRSG